MKKLRKIFGLALVLTAILCCLAFQASAAEVVASGYCGGEGDGTNLTWELTEDGVLTISGSGTMVNYSRRTDFPWYSYMSSIQEIIIGEGITSVGNYAFFGWCDMHAGVSDWDRECSCPDKPRAVYFEGNAPSVFSTDNPPMGTFWWGDIFYYIPGTTGWTDSEAYDADAGTWDGYTLKVWEEKANILASGYCGGEGDGTNLTWELTKDGVLTISGTGAMANYTYSNRVPWYSSGSVKFVVISDGVTTIADYAFAYCNNLSSVSIPDSVTSIGRDAFYGSRFGYCGGEGNGTNLSWEITEDGVLIISGNGAMKNYHGYYEPDYEEEPWYGFHSVVVEDGVTTIGDGAFYYCDLTDITIGESVTAIGESAFAYCNNLSSMYFKGNAPIIGAYAFDTSWPDDASITFYYIPGMTGWTDSDAYDADAGTWNGYKLAVWEEGNILASGYCGGEGDGTNLTWKLTKDGVLTISGTGAMANYTYNTLPWYSYHSSIKEVIIGDSVTTIGDHAFDNCAVAEVTIPDSITSIGTGAFQECFYLTSVTIPNGVTVINNATFSGCQKLTSVTLPDGITSIGDCAFNWTNLSEITIPDGVSAIGRNAFEHCTNLTSVAIPDSVTSIGMVAFAYSGLTSVSISDSVTAIEDYTFEGCTNLTNVTIGDSVTTIGDYAFYHCDDLTSLIIPDSVASIGGRAFTYCTSLTSVYFEGNASTVGSNVFEAGTTTLYYIPGTTGWTDSDTYDAEAGTWNGYKLAIWEERSPILASGYCGGEGDGTNLTWTLTKDGVLTISGSGLMQSCDTGDIGEPDFDDYDSEFDVFPYYIGSPWGSYYRIIKAVVIGEGVTNIGDEAFYCCVNMETIEIPSSVTTIDRTAFDRCDSLASIIVSDGNKNYSDVDGVLFDFAKLTLLQYPIGNTRRSYTIPEGVTTIGNYAFSYCDSLTSVIIPDSVTTIGDWAFGYCSSLTDVCFEGNAPKVRETNSNYLGSFSSATLYYIPGTTGWADSDAYDAEAGTWNGYKLEIWKREGTALTTVTKAVSALYKDMIQLNYVIAEVIDESGKIYSQDELLSNGQILVWYGDAVNSDATYKRHTESEALPLYKNGNYCTTVGSGIAAKDMGDVQKYRVCVVDDDGTVHYSDIFEYSVKQYAENILKKNESKDIPLLKALMNYGTAAQNYFGYKVDEPMNAILAEADRNVVEGYTVKAVKEDTAGKFRFTTTPIFKQVGKSAVFEGTIDLKIVLQMNTAYADSKLTLIYWDEDTYKAESRLTLGNAVGMNPIVASGTTLYGYITGIAAKNLCDTYYFTIMAEKDGRVFYSPLQTYSLHNYAANRISKAGDDLNLMKAMLIYSNAATARFG